MTSILNFYYPSIEGGGLEKNLFSLINSLAKKKYKINFFTYENNTRNKEFKKKFYFNKDINVVTPLEPLVSHMTCSSCFSMSNAFS